MENEREVSLSGEVPMNGEVWSKIDQPATARVDGLENSSVNDSNLQKTSPLRASGGQDAAENQTLKARHSEDSDQVVEGDSQVDIATETEIANEQTGDSLETVMPSSVPLGEDEDKMTVAAPEESREKYIVRDLTTGTAFDMDELQSQYELFTLEAAHSGESKQDLDDGKRMMPELEIFTGVGGYPPETEISDVERLSGENLSSIYSSAPASPSSDKGHSWMSPSMVSTSSDEKSIQVKALQMEEMRAQMEYLLPENVHAKLVGIRDHGLCRDTRNKLYTVYKIEMQCLESQNTWFVYRRYSEFCGIYDVLRSKGVSVPSLPRKKYIGSSFSPKFIVQRQEQLANWLQSTLTLSAVAVKEFREFLTFNADSTPPTLHKIWPAEDLEGFSKMPDTLGPGKTRMTLTDFELIRVIGKGSFGKVMLVRKKDSRRLYAMKVLNKGNVVKRKQVEHTRTERRVLGRTNHPFIVTLHYAFQTSDKLFFVLDYCAGGELFFHLTRMKKLPEHMARFYTAEITLALEHLHGLGVVYRDLKPENILLDEEGHVKLADFGLAKEGIEGHTEGTNSLCGTPEYLPPEILDRRGHGTAADWWNLGMVLYEMLTGLPPWYTSDRQKLFERLRSARLHFPHYVSRNSASLVRGLLQRNPAERLGGKNDADDLKCLPFFDAIDWVALAARKIDPPFNPCRAADVMKTSNFDKEFTKLPVSSEDNTPQLIQSQNGKGGRTDQQFLNFTFTEENGHMSNGPE